MDTPHTAPAPTTTNLPDRLAHLHDALRDAAYANWVQSRDPEQQSPRTLFERAFLGHYATIYAFVDSLIDGYHLDTRLDAAIAEPFRRYVDIDVTSLAQGLVANGTLYTLPAVPVGVWVFNGEIG